MKIKLNFLKKIFKPKKKINTQSFILGIIVAILIVIAAFVIIIGWGIYQFGWQNNFTNQVINIVPYPAARVNSSFILYKDFLKTVKAADVFYEKQRQAGFPNVPTLEEIKKTVLEDRLIENELVKIIAKRYNVMISQTQVDAEIDEIIKNKGSEEEFSKFLTDYYDISIKEYAKYFAEPNLYYDLTNQAVIDDENLNGEAKQKIQEVLNKLRNGDNFEDLAKEYSEGEHAEDGGAIGNFLRGELPQDLEDMLFSMEEGEFTDVVTMPGSLQVIKLEKKDEEKGVLTLKTILIKITTIEDLIAQEKEKAIIKIYAY